MTSEPRGRDDWGRPILLPGERPPRDWVAAWSAIGAVIIPLALALAGYAWHVEGALADLSKIEAQQGEQIKSQQRQLDDAIVRSDRHNEALDNKLDTITTLVGRTAQTVDDLRRELKR
jgi:hypothetical protein